MLIDKDRVLELIEKYVDSCRGEEFGVVDNEDKKKLIDEVNKLEVK